MDIMEFLEASIEDDENRAKIAAEYFRTAPAWWEFTQELRSAAGSDPDLRVGRSLRHVDRHSPAAVLAECAAKRKIIAHLKRIADDVDVQPILRILAEPYLDDSDFPKDWAR